MGESPKTILEANGILGRISVEFQLIGDCYSHSIWLIVENERIPIFTSCEDPSAPNVPCFTHLHQQGKNLFLTGANGGCHWSMSVEVGDAYFRGPQDFATPGEGFLFADRYGLNAPHRNRSDPAFHFLFFDVACRLKGEVNRLGSVYSKSDVVEYLGKCGASSGRVLQPLRIDKTEVNFGANPDGESLRFDPSPKCLLAREGDSELRITSSDKAISKYPATVQWSYGFWS